MNLAGMRVLTPDITASLGANVTKRIVIGVLAIAATLAARAYADPPERVGRISFLSGAVSFRTNAAAEWSPASLNYPVTIGDHVWADRTGRLELEMGATAVDLDSMTAISVLNMDHHIVQLRLLQGSAVARVRELASDESLEIDTPNGAITLLRPGLYRIDVGPNGDATTVTVRRGDTEVAVSTEAFQVHVGQTASVIGLDAPTHTLVAPAPLNEFDDWVMSRDRRVETTTTLYVPRTVVGYEDLEEFGTWRVVADYGPVWVPHARSGWAPYRFGRWAWVDPWGWSWIDEAAWGFAPFHYGRWAYVRDEWVWVPGAVVARPVYAPALVAFVGGPNWRVAGVGAPVGWFPLGPREAFVPTYAVSPAYMAAMNRPHVAVTNINVNVTNVTYVNRSAPGAVTVVSRDTFMRAQPVASAAVRVTPQAISSAVVIGHAAPREIAPVAVVRQATVVAPPANVTSRVVLVRRPPPVTMASAPVRRAAVSPPAPARVSPTPAAPTTAPVPAAAATPAPPTAAPRAAAVARPGPDRVAADRAAAGLAARHAQERTAIEARHATERAQLQARQAEESKRATNAKAQANAGVRHAREQAELDARQKREHDQMEKRQEAERRAHQ
jgi:hypothetical protein